MTITDEPRSKKIIPADVQADADALSHMQPEEAIDYLKKERPGFLDHVVYNEFMAGVDKYPATLPPKKYFQAERTRIAAIEDEETQGLEKLKLLARVTDVYEHGMSCPGALDFLADDKMKEHYAVMVRSEDDPKVVEKAAEKTEQKRESRFIRAATALAIGGTAAFLSGNALATGRPILHKPQTGSALVQGMDNAPEKSESNTTKVGVMLAGLLLASAGALGTFGRQPSNMAEEVIETLNPAMERAINKRLSRESGEGSLSRR